MFIPAKSELTSEDETLTRHVFFLDFNDEYQDLTKYSLIQQLNLPQLTAKRTGRTTQPTNSFTTHDSYPPEGANQTISKISFQCTPKCCTDYTNGIATTNAC